MMKAKVKATGEIVDVYHEPQHGQPDLTDEEVKLEVIPEELFASRIQEIKKSYIWCDTCKNLISTTFYPYGYDKEENEVWYLGICPDCGEIIHVTD